ncbi:hypothetical protein [Burkholderia vietnamiensis]|uniref:hypothetical protein n=1 Tax=Burkholderia vietnamiensis TaxID=60552 RepID=UPI000A7F238B|nr:hypothetical protein [Burkholderia vietnamiensis]
MALPQAKQRNCENFKAWLESTQAKRLANDARLRNDAQQNVFRFVMREMRKGFSLDEAGDRFIGIAKRSRQAAVFVNAARDTLVQVGWKPKRERE